MKFNITKIEIENFRSIQDKVTLNIKSGLFSIEGINYTETNSTNGSGKSTLISALFWAFLKQTRIVVYLYIFLLIKMKLKLHV